MDLAMGQIDTTFQRTYL